VMTKRYFYGNGRGNIGLQSIDNIISHKLSIILGQLPTTKNWDKKNVLFGTIALSW